MMSARATKEVAAGGTLEHIPRSPDLYRIRLQDPDYHILAVMLHH